MAQQKLNDEFNGEDTAVRAKGPYSRGIQDWIENGGSTATAPSRLRLVQNGLSSVSGRAPIDGTDSREAAPGLLVISESDAAELRAQWNALQTDFVDEPGRSVREAGKLVELTMQRITEDFRTERAAIEKKWDSGDPSSTEEMRLTFQRYRTLWRRFFDAA